MKQESKDLYHNASGESGFKHKITFQQQQKTSIVRSETKNRKRKIIWFNPVYSLNFSTNIGKKLLSLLGKHFPKTHQLHKLFSRINVKDSYGSLRGFKRVRTGHTKNKLNGQEKRYPSNCSN